MASADPSGFLPNMPNSLTYMLLRPLLIPFALACLGIGFVLWRFIGDIPSVLGMGFQVFFDALRPGRAAEPPTSGSTKVTYTVNDGLTALQTADPTFSPAGVLPEVQRMGDIAVAAWAARDLTPARAFMTDDGWTLQNAQLGRPAADGWRPYASSVALTADSILSVQSDATADHVTVRVSLIPHAGTAKVMRGRRIGRWIEDWRLTRTRAHPMVGRERAIPAGPWLIDRMDHVAVRVERAA